MKLSLKGMFLSSLLALAAVPLLRAQDEVTYVDREARKEAKITGKISSEDPGQIIIRPTTGASKEIPAGDVLDVSYEVPAGIRIDLRRANNAARDAEADGKEKSRKEALDQLKEVAAKIKEEKAQRHVEFKIARLLALKPADDKELTAAQERLSGFIKKHPSSWQLSHAARLLAQLQISAKDVAGAQKTYEDLAKAAGVSKEVAQDAQLKIVDLLLKNKKFPEAKKILTDLGRGLTDKDPQKVRLEVSQAACLAAEGQLAQAISKIEAVLNATQDANLKAFAYNTLGDCYRQAKKLEDARWQYLWVDVIYHQNREEHAKALYYLFKVSKDLNDDNRANQFRETLEKDPELAGCEYQRLVVTEK